VAVATQLSERELAALTVLAGADRPLAPVRIGVLAGDNERPAFRVGHSWRGTLFALERKGLVRIKYREPRASADFYITDAGRAALAEDGQFSEALIEEAKDNDHGEWVGEELRWSKALYLGATNERDRAQIHAEAKRAIRQAHRFWKNIRPDLPRAARARRWPVRVGGPGGPSRWLSRPLTHHGCTYPARFTTRRKRTWVGSSSPHCFSPRRSSRGC